ncbi:MAG: 1-acyl-sn-glycerol-3-phosphate acyltransferase [Anaerolineales bacterium]|nr:1-acyl-sn-glycerol-3-phosphate acyltransferase [Anaerolineales bacterium]
MHSLFFRLGLPAVDLYENLMFDIDIRRHQPLPGGPKILVSNHPSTTDPFLILEITPEPVRLLIEERLFQVPVFGSYLRLAGHIPVVPGNGRAAYRAALRTLRDNKSVALYPEGAISPIDGGLHKPRTGAARLALESGAPVVPIGVALDRKRIRLLESNVKGKPAVGTWYFRGPYALTVGAPLRFRGSVEDRELVESTADRIMCAIAGLERESRARIFSEIRPLRANAGIRAVLGDLIYD